MREAFQRWRRDGLVLATLSAPFALLVAGILAAAEAAGGWEALDYLVWALAAGCAWACTVLIYLAWTLLRDGWRLSSLPAIVVLCGVALLAAVWGYLDYAEDRECRAADRLFAGLADAPAAERAVTIGDAGRLVTDPSPCALDALLVHLGGRPASPSPTLDRRRHAALEELLQAGLPPADELLYGFAVDEPDADAVRLLLRHRRALNEEAGTFWDLFPDDLVHTLVQRATAAAPTAGDADRYRAVLAVIVQEGLPDPSILTDWTEGQLRGLGLLP